MKITCAVRPRFGQEAKPGVPVYERLDASGTGLASRPGIIERAGQSGHSQGHPFVDIFSLGFDAVDGTLARLTGTTSRFGAFLDLTLDRWAEIRAGLRYERLSASPTIAVPLFGLAVPLFMLRWLRARRHNKFAAQFPDAIDIIVRSLKAGHPVPIAIAGAVPAARTQQQQLAGTSLATDAERASIKYKQVEFMADKIGQHFQGVITGVTSFGLFVELAESKCEGLIPVRELQDDFYEFDEDNYCLTGRQWGRKFQLGDVLTVEVWRANLAKKQLDFLLVEEGESNATIHTHDMTNGKKGVKSRKPK